ncbi:hypothetical protein [Sanguibacter massiliensis]|uniref:hypothetical protein n=1 Tax=Sanguibacter massiliensis TaxID=1973217 RepID=UPI000C846483|nr:hypothetical protein [Sanguibacter massiliensis]
MSATPRTHALLGAAAACALALTACATPTAPTTAPTTPAASATTDAPDTAPTRTEAAAAKPRLVLTYDGGLLVVDALQLDVVDDLPLAGFNRVSPAGDDRHVAVSTSGGWALLDTGAWSVVHGEHAHHYTQAPSLTGVVLAADTPGHVVPHDGLVALFDDGTGHVTVVEADAWATAAETGHVAPVRELTAAAAHHGVAVPTEDNAIVLTVGDAEGRSGATVLDAHGDALVTTEDCPGVHGEATSGHLVLLGCEDGVVAIHDDRVHKLDAPDDFGRTGNLFAADDSAVVLGDYKTDPDGGLGLTTIALVDTEAERITTVDTGTTYTFRGLGRGENGEALVLGTDGALHVFDPATGEEVDSISVVDPWEVPAEWQTAHPALTVLDGMAYVTDPASRQIHAVDVVEGSVWRSAVPGSLDPQGPGGTPCS